jgi:anti-sigma factor RsiW
MANAVHDLTAAYALDALDAEDVRAYEEHLAHCERCREELASLGDAASALAFATEAASPPPELRARILQQAQRERPNVVPLRPRWLVPVAAAAAVAACVALGLGLWAASLSNKLDHRTQALGAQQQITAILSNPGSRRNALADGRGSLVVSPSGRAVLVVNRLDAAPGGHTYEAWVASGRSPQPAGTFPGGGDVNVVLLARPVPSNAAVMLTVEKSGGSAAPTGHPLLTVRNASQS